MIASAIINIDKSVIQDNFILKLKTSGLKQNDLYNRFCLTILQLASQIGFINIEIETID